MDTALKVSIGQHSDRGRKRVNQDFHGALVPGAPLLATKGVAVALADGIGSSEVSQVASQFAVQGFLDDYYCTSEAWSVKKSVERVLAATNAWLHSRTRLGPHAFDQDRGYVCTFSALVLKSNTAHLFHVGDSRIYRLHGDALEQLTQDHRIQVAGGRGFLSRAVGFKPQVEIDYLALPIETGDVFLLTTDGVHEHVDGPSMAAAVRRARHDLDGAAREIVAEALRRGSPDNATLQIVAVEALPAQDAREARQRHGQLPLPPPLEARMILDGHRIVRQLHLSHRSHIHLAVDLESGAPLVLKTPSTDLRDDADGLERFLLEEWVARRIDSPHVLKPCPRTRPPSHLYVAMEFIDGRTLAQWMVDHPRPSIETVRGIVEQVARGLQAFHRLDMLHQDLRPENIMIDATGTVKIIDFGSVRVAGLQDDRPAPDGAPAPILGTVQYTAPEYFLGQPGSERSDLYSLAAITYQMLSGRLPYGTAVAKARTPAAQRRLRCDPVLDDDRDIPFWIDGVLRKALHPDPARRHEALSEFVHDLRHPKRDGLDRVRPPLVQQHPVLFWKIVSTILGIALLALLMARHGGP